MQLGFFVSIQSASTMVNFNGTITAQPDAAIHENRAFLYGDAVFETMRVLDGRILFAEDHYFRLMASMRILRMEIPMNFTPEYMAQQVMALIGVLGEAPAWRVRLSVYRKHGGYYLPESNDISFVITASPLANALYTPGKTPYEADLYRDFYVAKQLLSTLKTANRAINITGSIYAAENGLQDCFLINDEKNVIEALRGNIFMLMGSKLVTPPVADGCLNGIMRKQVLAIARKIEGIEATEASISPFDLQKADELFVTNVISGVQPVTRYRKKEYEGALSSEILKRLNAQVRLG